MQRVHDLAGAAPVRRIISGVLSMANDEHVALLLNQEVTAWNAWRDKNLNIRPDLTEADLICKNWYPNSRTMSDDHVYSGTKDYRSARTLAVKPRAFGVPLTGFEA